MQNLLQISGRIMLLACLSIVLLTSCNQKSKLKLAIEAVGKECPIDLGVVGEITSITFDGADVIYTMTMSEDYLNIEALKKNPDAIKASASTMFLNPQDAVKDLLDLLVQADAGMKLVYKGQTSGEEISCQLSTDDLKKILNQEISQEESALKKLEEQARTTNISCPMVVDEITTLDSLVIEADRAMYYYTIDENSIDMASLKESKEELRQNVISSLKVSEPAVKVFFESCLECNKGVGYHYKGNISGESIEFTLTASEVKALF